MIIQYQEGHTERICSILQVIRLSPTDIQLPMEADGMGEEAAVMNSICSFVDFLASKLELNGVGSTLKEDITPVLSVLYNMARALRPVRKYLKTTLLPPLQVLLP